jgi:hypothetical protein
MRRNGVIAVYLAFAWVAFAMPVGAEKPLDLGKTKFKEIAKYLNLTADQQQKIKPDVERIQEIVKQAAKQRGTPGFGAGGRTPVGGSRWGGGIGGNPGGVPAGERQKQEAQRVEWQKEITNRTEEIRSFLTPGQLEKFKTIQVPDILSSTIGG